VREISLEALVHRVESFALVAAERISQQWQQRVCRVNADVHLQQGLIDGTLISSLALGKSHLYCNPKPRKQIGLNSLHFQLLQKS
jgi:hypothetical protein